MHSGLLSWYRFFSWGKIFTESQSVFVGIWYSCYIATHKPTCIASVVCMHSRTATPKQYIFITVDNSINIIHTVVQVCSHILHRLHFHRSYSTTKCSKITAKNTHYMVLLLHSYTLSQHAKYA